MSTHTTENHRFHQWCAVPGLRPLDAGLTRVRRAEPSDLPSVVEIGREAWRATFQPLVGADYSEAGLRRAWDPDVVVAEISKGWVHLAHTGSEPSGMVSARPQGDEVFLSRLYVRPSHQRQGVGHLLLDAVLRAATGSVALTVLSTNARARSFYEAHGFQGDGLLRDLDGGPDQLRMIRKAHPGAFGGPLAGKGLRSEQAYQ